MNVDFMPGNWIYQATIWFTPDRVFCDSWASGFGTGGDLHAACHAAQMGLKVIEQIVFSPDLIDRLAKAADAWRLDTIFLHYERGEWAVEFRTVAADGKSDPLTVMAFGSSVAEALLMADRRMLSLKLARRKVTRPESIAADVFMDRWGKNADKAAQKEPVPPEVAAINFADRVDAQTGVRYGPAEWETEGGTQKAEFFPGGMVFMGRPVPKPDANTPSSLFPDAETSPVVDTGPEPATEPAPEPDTADASAADNAETDDLITAEAAAAMLSVSATTLMRRARAGLLPQPVEMGKYKRFSRAEIIAAIDAMKAARTAPPAEQGEAA